MILCQHCGGEVVEGKDFCPHCGQRVASAGGTTAMPAGASTALQTVPEEGREQRSDAFVTGSPVAAPMMGFGRRTDEPDKTRRTVFIAIAVVAALLLAGLAWLATRPRTEAGDERLEGAIRPDSAEFEQIRDRLVVEFDPDEDATIGANALGNLVVTMNPTVRNFTQQTVSALEFHASGLDLSGQTIRERTFVRSQQIEPNRISKVPVSLNFPQDRRPAQLKLELTGVKFR